MIEHLNKLPNEYEDNLNLEILNNSYDLPIIEYIYHVFKGMEILPNIKILGYEWDPNEERYNMNDHVVRRNTNKSKVIKNMAETRCGTLYLDVCVQGLTKEGTMRAVYLRKPIVIPLQDDKGYYLIKGKKCYLIYQLVDKMLYPSFGAVTIKSLMPVCVGTDKAIITDTTNQEHTVPIYTIKIFKNAINVLMVYSHLGITKTLNFMEVSRFMRVLDKNTDYKVSDKFLYFECGKKSDIIVCVKKSVFEQEVYVRSITGCLINLLTDNKVKYEYIDDWTFWMKTVGGKDTVVRGQYQHIFFKRLLDDVTRMEAPINDYDKQNIYYLLRWVVQNYHTMWSKDNLSMTNKRLRKNEYIAALLTSEISKRINRLVSLGNKATIKEYLNAFKFPEDIFITKIYGSGILRYSETNSDVDVSSKLKLTKKGFEILAVA